MTAPPPFSSGPFSFADRLARRGVHYGWVVVAVTFLTMMVGACVVGAGVLIKPLQAEFGWDTADISAAFAVRLALFGLVGPFAAVRLNYFGVPWVATAGLALIGLAGALCLIAALAIFAVRTSRGNLSPAAA